MNQDHEKKYTVVEARLVSSNPDFKERKMRARYQSPGSAEIFTGNFWVRDPKIIDNAFQEDLVKKDGGKEEHVVGFAQHPLSDYDKQTLKLEGGKEQLIELYFNEGHPSKFIFTNGFEHKKKQSAE